MANLFNRARHALGFGSSQFIGSSINDAEAMESPFRSSQSYLNTKVKSPKKRKSFEENGGSGKKKRKKHRHSIDYDQEFEGFGDVNENEALHESAPTSPLDVKYANGVEDVEKSKKSQNAENERTRKHKSPGKCPDMANGVNGESTSERPQATTSITIQNDDVVETPKSRSARKRERKKLRRLSLESAKQTNGTEPKESKQSVYEDANSAPTPGPLLVNGITAESVTKSKKKRKKERELSSLSNLENGAIGVQNEEMITSSPLPMAHPKKKSKTRRKSSISLEVGIPTEPLLNQPEDIHNRYAEKVEPIEDWEGQENFPASSLIPVGHPKKKSKKRRKSSLSLEADIHTEPVIDQPEDAHGHHAGSAKPIEDGEGQENFPVFDTTVTPKREREHMKADIPKEQTHTSNEILAEPSKEHEAKSQKPKKLKEHRSSEGRASAEPHDPLNVEPKVPNYAGAERSDHLNGLPEPKQGDGRPSHERVNGTQYAQHSPEPEQDVNPIAPQSRQIKSKKPKKKTATSVTIDQAEADTQVESPPIVSELQNPWEASSSNLRSSERASPALRESSNAERNIPSSKAKKSKNRNRETAFKESFGRIEDDLTDYILHNPLPGDSIQSAPSPSWQAINREPLRSTPSQSIGIFDASGSRVTNLRKSQILSSRGKGLENEPDTKSASNAASPTGDDHNEQSTVKVPIADSKRKRAVKADGGDVNPEALRLPAKKRRTRKPAAQSPEEREVNPEALRLPEKTGSKKSTASGKKEPKTAAAAASSSAVKLKGPFTDDEVEAMKNALDSFAEMNDMTEHTVRETLQANARTNAKTSALLKELYEALPDRPPESIVKVSRRKFHNFPRYGKWTSEEDKELKEAVKRHNSSWVKVAADLDRHPEDVRDRWRNYVVCGSKLDKGAWTKDEEDDMMSKIEIRLQNLRNAWSAEQYEAELKKGRTEYELLDWNLISEDMGRTRSRLQCQQKYKQITEKQEPGATWTRKEDPETRSWRTKKGKAEVTFMKPGDKLMLLRGIQRAGYGREDKISFNKIGDEAFKKSFTDKAKKLALKFIRRDMPGQEDMTLQEVVAQAIENIENEFPDRLTQRYDPEVDGETYPTRKRQSKPRSGRMVTGSDDEDSGDGSSSEESEHVQIPRGKPKLRDRMRRQNAVDEDDEDDEVEKSHRTKSKSPTTESEERGDDEMDVDQDGDVDMPDNTAEEDSKSRSQYPHLEEELAIEDPDNGGQEPSSYRSNRQTSEKISDDEDHEAEDNGAMLIDIDTSHNLLHSNFKNIELLNDVGDNGNENEAGNQISEAEEEGVDERGKRGSSASSRGREFRLGRRDSNLEDVEISSDDSFEDIPAVRPVPAPKATKTSSKRDMVRRRQR